MHIYVMHAHTKSLSLTIQWRALYKFTYVLDQIWLPHTKYRLPHTKYSSHGQHTIREYWSNMFTYIYQKHNQLQLLLNTIAKYVPEANMPSKLGIYAIYAQYFCVYLGDVCASGLPGSSCNQIPCVSPCSNFFPVLKWPKYSYF